MPDSVIPQHCPSPRELDDLELLVSGALAPLTAFDEPGSPVTLALPDDLVAVPELELVDPEGLPLARATRGADGSLTLAALTHAQYGPFRRLHLGPAAVRKQLAGRTFVPVTGPVTDAQLAQLEAAGPLVLLALVGTGTPDLSPVALLRATLRVADTLPDAVVVAVPLASHGDAVTDHALGVQVVGTYAGADPVLGLVDAGDVLPDLDDIVDADQPEPADQGLVLFFTGLSGSGKSTLAQALMDRLLEQGGRTLTSLDGDVVRRNLSAGLTFSKADRETNIRRIGWVAAEISRHGGVAVCSPIAPFDETRQQVREMVDDAGGAFFLVHVATPLAECERRDRKGLYAKARRGEIPEFTGISSPYEEPTDADVRVDTTGRTIADALDDVIEALAEAGYLDLRSSGGLETVASATSSTTGAPEVEEGALAPSAVEEGALAPSAVEEGALAPVTRPFRVLFVCTANICRSPTMELVARHLAGPDSPVTFASAGIHGFVDSPMDDVVAATLPARGIDPSGFRSRPLTRAMVAEADVVITAEALHRTFILDDDPAAFRKVFSLGQLAESIEALTDEQRAGGAAGVMTALRARRAGTDGHDISDPYRRGAEAAEMSTKHIESLLQIVVPALVGSEKMAQ